MKFPKTQLGWLGALFVGFVILLVLTTLIAPLVSGEHSNLAPPTLDATRLPPAKRTVAFEEQARLATALAGTRPPKVATTPVWTAVPTVLAELTRKPAGVGTIVEDGQAPIPAAYIYTFTNRWEAQVTGRLVRVYAGAQRGDGARELPRPWQGLVFVIVSTPDGMTILPLGCIAETPSKGGPLRIVDANGMRLKLTSEAGESFVFDVTSCTFVSP